MARSAASAVTAPGSRASAAARRSPCENTAWRSERCATAHAAASAPCSPRSENRSGKGSSRSARVAFARTVSAENPSSAACRSHDRRSSPLSTSRFLARVINAARSASFGFSKGAPSSRANIAASISARRVENSSTTSRDTPEISNLPSGWVFSIPYPKVLETPGKLGPVDRADRHLVPVEPVVDHRSPLPVLALHHVRHYGMGVELGVEVAGSVVAEGCGHHLLAAGVDHHAARLVLHPGLDGVPFDPAEGPCDGPVVRGHDPVVTTHQRHEGDRLGSRKRDVAARPVMDLSVLVPLAQVRAVRDLPSSTAWNVSGSTGPESPRSSAPLPTHALASLGAGSSLP